VSVLLELINGRVSVKVGMLDGEKVEDEKGSIKV